MKALRLFFILLCLGQAPLFAQEEASRFRLELSSQSIFTQGSNLVIAPNIDFYIGEKSFNYASHLSGFWRLGNRLELGFGLGYANRDAYVVIPFCRLAPCRRPSGSTAEGYTRIRSLEIPVELRWKYWKSAKRIVPYFSVGIANRIPVVNPFFFGSEKSKLSPGNYVMGVILGAGTQIRIFEKWSLVVAIQIRKDSNFSFDENIYWFMFQESKWFNEGVVKLGVGRNF